MKTYVLTLSRVFPAKHKKKGQSTFFRDKFHAAISRNDEYWNKLHTIRANYPLWKKRFEQIERGEACLSVRQWTGKPYASKQEEIARLTKDDGIGLQMLRFARYSDGFIYLDSAHVDDHDLQVMELAKNDGLDYGDWLSWFKGYNLSEPLAIIQFTKFRY